MARFFLGLDASTQSLTAVLIDLDAGAVVHRDSLPFSALPEWGAPQGFLPHPDPVVRHAPPLLWVDALDRLLARLRANGASLDRVLALSGSGQQHGSVWLAPGFAALLSGLDPTRSPVEPLRKAFTLPTAPIWMDGSTGAECAEIAAALGGPLAVARITGSPPIERFTGPQIRAVWKRDPNAYARTGRIHLVSSFMASLLGGLDAPIDTGDGAGMNLLDLRTRAWNREALLATAPDLEAKLPPVVPSGHFTGPVSPYWSRRHGLNPKALNLAWSGDNPCSLVGMGIIGAGRSGVSLGTSDTCFSALAGLPGRLDGSGHIFGHPAGGWMRLVCFRNGSLARQRVRDRFGLDWTGFSHALERAPLGNRGGLLIPWFEPETVPRVPVAGAHLRGIAPDDSGAQVRGVVEGQLLAMRLHAGWADSPPDSIRVTGGGSVNQALLQAMADVCQGEVSRSEIPDGAALGAALRAAHAWLSLCAPVDWAELTHPFTRPRPETFRPAPGSDRESRRMLAAYAAFEAESLSSLGLDRGAEIG